MIVTAIAIFGRAGYRRASTREIAAEAEVNPPALQYYFDGKLGLYHACIDYVTSEIFKRVHPALAAADAMVEARAPAEALIEALCVILETMIDSFFARDEGTSIWRLLAWEDAEAETMEARHLLRDRVTLPAIRTGSRLVGAILDRPADDRQTLMHTVSIFGQAAVFHLDKSRIFDALGWGEPDAEGIRLLKSILRAQSTALLKGLAAAQAAAGS